MAAAAAALHAKRRQQNPNFAISRPSAARRAAHKSQQDFWERLQKDATLRRVRNICDVVLLLN
eukprot:768646-Hanusia_phi.AAC.8